jgi:hypothetical protein
MRYIFAFDVEGLDDPSGWLFSEYKAAKQGAEKAYLGGLEPDDDQNPTIKWVQCSERNEPLEERMFVNDVPYAFIVRAVPIYDTAEEVFG